MMQDRHVEVAAQHASSILRWTASTRPLTGPELHDALDAIYREEDTGHQLSASNGGYSTWKSITFDGVSLAYYHFFGQQPEVWQIKEFLNEAGDNADWGVINLERSGILADT